MQSPNIFNHKEYETKSINNDFVSQMTPSDVPTTCDITSYKYVVPIIFIPGIMGSNLKKGRVKVWYPPNMSFSGTPHLLGEAIMGVFRSAKSRQSRLDPKTTTVGFDGPIYLRKSKLKLTKNEAQARGWGSVWWDGYGDILVYLEKYLNERLVSKNASDQPVLDEEWAKIVEALQIKTAEAEMDAAPETVTDEAEMDAAPENQTDEAEIDAALRSENQPEIKPNDSKNENKAENTKDASLPNEYLSKWKLQDEKKSAEMLTSKEFSKVGLVGFPVYACGYNWLQSNDISARDIARLMGKIKQEYTSNGSKPEFLKFIIVTHSMGGLVARSIVQQGLMADDIGGVVHGAMPSSGAPAVYQRIVKGWDGFDVSGNIFSALSSPVFGHNTERLTPVLANAPGALQLLPFANFNDQKDFDWFKIQVGTRTVKVPVAGNPYANIYTKQNVWWEMVNPKILDPAGILKKRMENENKEDVIYFYHDNIEVVKSFHIEIQDCFHDKTYANYGADPNFKATGDIIWRADKASVNDLICMTDEAIINIASEDMKADPQSPYVFNDRLRIAKYTYNGVKKKVTFKLDIELRSPGDGTVCFQSGQDVRAENRNLLGSYLINGFEHSKSYKHPDVQLNTIYCISKLIDQLIDDSEVGEISLTKEAS